MWRVGKAACNNTLTQGRADPAKTPTLPFHYHLTEPTTTNKMKGEAPLSDEGFIMVCHINEVDAD